MVVNNHALSNQGNFRVSYDAILFPLTYNINVKEITLSRG